MRVRHCAAREKAAQRTERSTGGSSRIRHLEQLIGQLAAQRPARTKDRTLAPAQQQDLVQLCGLLGGRLPGPFPERSSGPRRGQPGDIGR